MHLLAITCFIFFFSGTHTIVGYWPFTKWPAGKFSIPSTRSSGCPESSDFAFEYGQRTYDCEDDKPISDTSVGIHLDITVDSEKDIHLSFCTKNVELNDESLTGGDWPSGKYCFFRVGGSCPLDFHSGWILWQDEKTSNRNEESGTLPDGEYSYGKTKMFFCCRIDGDPETMIELPRGRSFVLLKYGEECQKVEGTRAREEYVLWDNDERDLSSITHDGVLPETGITELGDVQLNFCYYSKISYCGNPGVPDNGEVDSERYTAGSTLRFSCNEGYRLSGMDEVTCLTTEKWNSEIPACKEIHNCEEENGGCDHTCIDLEAGVHRCECDSGYSLEDDGRCSDIDECADPDIALLCQHQCVNHKGGYHCECDEGYELEPDDRGCSDVDECSADPPICQQKCVNNQGSYTCSCYSGFVVGSPPNTCDDIDECQQHHPCQHVCTNIAGSYRCGCIDGFQLEADNSTCRNKNPCFDKYNVCEQRCQLVDTQEEFECLCESGFRLNSDGMTCDDINECTDGTHECTQICDNKENGYTCSCKAGFYLDSDSYTCLDINECECGADEGCGGCEQTCVNTKGSYHCQCRTSYVALRPDSSQCVIPYSVQDPCRNSNCINMMYAECLRDGNKTTCICKPGYYLNYNGTNCIKEYCETNPCPQGQICEERQDSRVCMQDDNTIADPSAVGDESDGQNTNLLIVLITVVVVVLWFAIMTIVVMVIKRRRAKKKGTRFVNELQQFPQINSLPHNIPIMNRPSSLLDNPIYHANSLYNTSHSDDQEHEYEELDKLGHRLKKFASNSYDQGVNMLDDGEAYSYAVTPGPPPPSHILPPPVPPQISPEYV